MIGAVGVVRDGDVGGSSDVSRAREDAEDGAAVEVDNASCRCRIPKVTVMADEERHGVGKEDGGTTVVIWSHGVVKIIPLDQRASRPDQIDCCAAAELAIENETRGARIQRDVCHATSNDREGTGVGDAASLWRSICCGVPTEQEGEIADAASVIDDEVVAERAVSKHGSDASTHAGAIGGLRIFQGDGARAQGCVTGDEDNSVRAASTVELGRIGLNIHAVQGVAKIV